MNPRIRKAIWYMTEDLTQPLSLPTVARIAGYSPAYFCAAFKNEIGTSPVRYHKLLRLKKACELLETDSALYLSIGEIAAQVGFCDLSHFVRDFEKQFRVSPKGYRARYWNERDTYHKMKFS